VQHILRSLSQIPASYLAVRWGITGWELSVTQTPFLHLKLRDAPASSSQRQTNAGKGQDQDISDFIDYISVHLNFLFSLLSSNIMDRQEWWVGRRLPCHISTF
jgi:hypothetical protein